MKKYHNSKTLVNGVVFDSKKEAERWQELTLLQDVGLISDLRRQVKYELIPAQRDPHTGKLIERSCSYFADFCYREKGTIVVEDTKGVKTPEYIIKRKLMLYKYGIQIKES